MKADGGVFRILNGVLAIMLFGASGFVLLQATRTEPVIVAVLLAVLGVWGLLGVVVPQVGLARVVFFLDGTLVEWH